ncbi:MAG: TonB-dependent receptor [candidate division WOR-3 bacterium]
MVNFILIPFIFSGITGKIQGVVKDEDTKEPIAFADVILLNTEMGSATDENGNFFILNVPPGRYSVEISYLGYQTKRIEDVMVEIDRTTRLNITLKPSVIEIAPVTVYGETPKIKKDYVATTQIVRKPEIATLPIDYTPTVISFQAAVARTDTALHVRGGRATEVQYMIDNVSIIDPQTGDLAIELSKGIVEEVIFLPGGFDVEYGRAMSGVVNLISERPQKSFKGNLYAKTEKIMPFYYDFGYENYQSTIHLPATKNFLGLASIDIMQTQDWDPRLYILPHKKRQDYSLYTKWLFTPSQKFNLSLSGAKSRSQFDRYTGPVPFFKFHLDNYRSDMRKGNLATMNLSYLPSNRMLFNLTLSRLYTKRIFGVREMGSYQLFDDFKFRDYNTLTWPQASHRNPFGVTYYRVISEGDYPQYQEKSSEIYNLSLRNTFQVHNYHELKSGIEYIYQNLGNFTYLLCGDTLNPIADEYRHQPREYSVYLQDNIDYKGFYAKLGARYDYLGVDIEGVKPKKSISPRLGCSFLVTEKFLFRANIGRYVQPPLYDYIYPYYKMLPLPPQYYSYIGIVGNPDLNPERTLSYEIGLQGEIKENLIATTNIFYKDVTDLTGTRYIPALPVGYFQYFNVEYANIKGLEAILEFTNRVFSGKVSYTLSWARGTSSYAGEYADTSITRPAQDYYLNFDQRHRIFIQGALKVPFATTIYLFSYFGNGFPYTPPGYAGKYEERNIFHLPFQREFDCLISKQFHINHLSLNLQLEVLNLLDERYEVAPHYPFVNPEDIKPEDFDYYLSITNPYYSPAADFNHDGLMTPYESFHSFRELIKATDDWVAAYTAPRRARIGITIGL